jgi:hypothetical protein
MKLLGAYLGAHLSQVNEAPKTFIRLSPGLNLMKFLGAYLGP